MNTLRNYFFHFLLLLVIVGATLSPAILLAQTASQPEVDGSAETINNPQSTQVTPPQSPPASGEGYKLLAPLPGIGTHAPLGGGLANFLQKLINYGMAIAIALAVLYIVMGGFQYVSSEALAGKSGGKEKITNALIGLILMLAVYLILNTINPNLLNLNLLIEPVRKPKAVEGIPSNSNSRIVLPGGVSGYKALPGGTALTGVPMKAGICGGGTCYVSMMVQEKLLDLKENANGMSWHVTEAYPPTRDHKDPCHYNGTCVDANITGSRNGTDIAAFIAAADKSDIRAIYEVESNGRMESLIKAGVPANRILVPMCKRPPCISGEHFSLY